MTPVAFSEARYRDCSFCGTKNITMAVRWSDRRVEAAGRESRAWSAMTCPRCGGATLIEFSITSNSGPPGQQIDSESRVTELRVLPAGGEALRVVKHLPEDVGQFFSDAQRVLDAGVPGAAAVQLRKTLEAAAKHKDVEEKTLYKSVEKLIELGYITKDFGKLLDHVRKIGNIGAHATDEKLDGDEVDRALRFTTQVLRNLFEVPGELDELDNPKEVVESPAPRVARASGIG